jgi:CRP-like cAMP-binding protein
MEKWWQFVAATHWWQLAAAIAIVLSVAQYWMKTMIPLRAIAITTNVLFLLYAAMAPVYTTLILNCILLPLNSFRLYEMWSLIRRTENASRSDLDMSWLRPFMTSRRVQSNEVLFHKDDVADSMYLVVSGRFRLTETGMEVSPGTVVGELGMLAPERRRTLSLECEQEGEILSLSYERFEQIYFQNPAFGLSFLKLASGRLFQNIARLEAELATAKAAPSSAEARV